MKLFNLSYYIWVIALLSLNKTTSLSQGNIYSAVKDNTIISENLNSNATGNLFCGRIRTGGLRRALLQFDISGIPDNATITSVTCTLTKTRGASSNIAFHRLLSDWGEGTSMNGGTGGGQGSAATTGDATWEHSFFSDSSWTTMGGDYVSSASSTTSVGGSNSYSWSGPGMVADVQFWIDNPATNFGWIMVGNENNNSTAARFNSRESNTGKPFLEIEFNIPMCQDSLILLNTIASGIYDNLKLILASGVIEDGSIVEFNTTDGSELLPDFSLELGGELQIIAEACMPTLRNHYPLKQIPISSQVKVQKKIAQTH